MVSPSQAVAPRKAGDPTNYGAIPLHDAKDGHNRRFPGTVSWSSSAMGAAALVLLCAMVLFGSSAVQSHFGNTKASHTFVVHTDCLNMQDVNRVKDYTPFNFDVNEFKNVYIVHRNKGSTEFFNFNTALKMRRAPNSDDEPGKFTLTTNKLDNEYGFVLENWAGKIYYEIGHAYPKSKDCTRGPECWEVAMLAGKEECAHMYGSFWNRVVEAGGHHHEHVFGSCEHACPPPPPVSPSPPPSPPTTPSPPPLPSPPPSPPPPSPPPPSPPPPLSPLAPPLGGSNCAYTHFATETHNGDWKRLKIYHKTPNDGKTPSQVFRPTGGQNHKFVFITSQNVKMGLAGPLYEVKDMFGGPTKGIGAKGAEKSRWNCNYNPNAGIYNQLKQNEMKRFDYAGPSTATSSNVCTFSGARGHQSPGAWNVRMTKYSTSGGLYYDSGDGGFLKNGPMNVTVGLVPDTFSLGATTGEGGINHFESEGDVITKGDLLVYINFYCPGAGAEWGSCTVTTKDEWGDIKTSTENMHKTCSGASCPPGPSSHSFRLVIQTRQQNCFHALN